MGATTFRQTKKLLGYITELNIGSGQTRILMPNTYMNESGRSVSAALKWFDLPIHQMLVIVDDMDLPLGAIRFRQGGGSGGHNGLKNIIMHFNNIV